MRRNASMDAVHTDASADAHETKQSGSESGSVLLPTLDEHLAFPSETPSSQFPLVSRTPSRFLSPELHSRSQYVPLDDFGFNPSTAKEIREVYCKLASVEALYEQPTSTLHDAMKQSQTALEHFTSVLKESYATRCGLSDRLRAACGLGDGNNVRTDGKFSAEAAVRVKVSARSVVTGQWPPQKDKDRGMDARRLSVDIPSSPDTSARSSSASPSSNGVSPNDRARRPALIPNAATAQTATRTKTIEPLPARTRVESDGDGGGGRGGGGGRRDSPERPMSRAEGPAGGQPRTSLLPVARLRAVPMDGNDAGARAARGGAGRRSVSPVARLRAPSESGHAAAAAAAVAAAADGGERGAPWARGRVRDTSLGGAGGPSDPLAPNKLDAPGRRLRSWSSPGRRRPSLAELRGSLGGRSEYGAGAVSRRLASAVEAAAALGDSN
jgi:hypothetical protein